MLYTIENIIFVYTMLIVLHTIEKCLYTIENIYICIYYIDNVTYYCKCCIL